MVPGILGSPFGWLRGSLGVFGGEGLGFEGFWMYKAIGLLWRVQKPCGTVEINMTLIYSQGARILEQLERGMICPTNLRDPGFVLPITAISTLV